jgi:hypothetical protein
MEIKPYVSHLISTDNNTHVYRFICAVVSILELPKPQIRRILLLFKLARLLNGSFIPNTGRRNNMAHDRMKNEDLDKKMNRPGQDDEIGKQDFGKQTPGRNPQQDQQTGQKGAGQHNKPGQAEGEE